VSVVLLAISVWMRAKLSRARHFAKLREEGEVTKAPLREAFADRQSEARADRLLRHHVRAGRGLVLHLLLHAGVPRKVARRAGATKDLLLIVMTVVSAPLYVFFGWLSDRIGRKPVMLGGMLLALALYFPGSHWIAAPPIRRWSPRSKPRR
jgi:ribosomal protein L13E